MVRITQEFQVSLDGGPMPWPSIILRERLHLWAAPDLTTAATESILGRSLLKTKTETLPQEFIGAEDRKHNLGCESTVNLLSSYGREVLSRASNSHRWWA